jgi:hypothetical protein
MKRILFRTIFLTLVLAFPVTAIAGVDVSISLPPLIYHMPVCSEIAPRRRRRSSASEEWRKRTATTTNVVKPGSVQPVQGGGIR